MKINAKWRFLCIAFFVSISIFLASLGTWSCKKSQLDEKVIEAYELRMNAKADEANAQLEQLLAENPGYADAHYELARARLQLGLANVRELMTDINNIQHTIEQAIKIDPDNVIYAFFAAYVSCMRAYIALQKDETDAKEKVARSCSFYESALKLKPDYHEAMLYLVEIYGVLPEDKGGDRAKAEQYAKQLEEMDKIYGAKARAILMPDDADYVGYWKTIQKEHEGNADVLVELGRAYLIKGMAEDGVDCYEQALRIDTEQTLLLLDLARYYAMSGMRDEKKKETFLPLAENMFRRYLDTEPITPLKAFATRLLANLKRIMGDKEEAEKLFEVAETIDPFVSKAFGIPSLDLFIPLGEISHYHRYFFTPL
jgi:tetratricopeptide (TPR) repeat protein